MQGKPTSKIKKPPLWALVTRGSGSHHSGYCPRMFCKLKIVLGWGKKGGERDGWGG